MFASIEGIRAALEGSIRALALGCPISIVFGSPVVFVNDEKTRTFLALPVVGTAHARLVDVVRAVDRALTRFDLPPYYAEPAMHVSVAWAVGDVADTFRTCLASLEEAAVSVWRPVLVQQRAQHCNQLVLCAGHLRFPLPLVRAGV